jgi:hypothetical protein
MRRPKLFSITLALLAVGGMAGSGLAADFVADLQLGYEGAPGAQAGMSVKNFASGLPLALRLGVGYSRPEPGSAADARRIFINDATNGTPEKSAQAWTLRFDMVAPVEILGSSNVHLFGGFRRTYYTANFKYIGGNEDFDVTTEPWGLGAGIGGSFAMGGRMDFLLNAGFDYYFSDTLKGHDTSYNKDGEDVNPRNDYTWDDADAAVSQPGFELLFMLGVNYHFGY